MRLAVVDLSLPNPGSPEAKAAGCKCPVIDNGRGLGWPDDEAPGGVAWWINGECPIHGSVMDA